MDDGVQWVDLFSWGRRGLLGCKREMHGVDAGTNPMNEEACFYDGGRLIDRW